MSDNALDCHREAEERGRGDPADRLLRRFAPANELTGFVIASPARRAWQSIWNSSWMAASLCSSPWLDSFIAASMQALGLGPPSRNDRIQRHASGARWHCVEGSRLWRDFFSCSARLEQSVACIVLASSAKRRD